MTKRKQPSHRRLSAKELGGVSGGLMPYEEQFSLRAREARWYDSRRAPRIWKLAR